MVFVHPESRVAPVVWESPEPDWRTRAACRDEDVKLFVPDSAESNRGSNKRIRAYAEAKAFCRDNCTVQHDCLLAALTAPFVAVGVWGGTDDEERAVIRRRNRNNTRK